MLNSFDILLIIEYVISICYQTMGHGTDDIYALTKVHCHCVIHYTGNYSEC